MRRGLRYVQVTLGVSVAMAIGATSAQAYIYWAIGGADGSGGTTIGRADLDGSGVSHSFAGGASNPAALTIDGNYIYWANDGTFSIGRMKLNGTDPQPNWIPNLSGSAAGIAVDGSYIYWTDGERYIGRATIAGGGIDPTFIDIGVTTDPAGLAVQGSTLYVGTENQIRTVSTSGGTVSPLGPTLGAGVQVTSLAVAGGYVYFGEFGAADGIGRMQTDGMNETGSLITGLEINGGVATDGTYLYWTDATGDEIGRALLGSAGATDINPDFISEPDDPFGIAVNASIDHTTTTISCTPAKLSAGQASACTARVGDSASTSAPTGTVNFTGNGAAFFSGSPCQLMPKAGGGATCTVGADLTSSGAQSITATYSGDSVHEASSASHDVVRGSLRQTAATARVRRPEAQGQDAHRSDDAAGKGSLHARQGHQAEGGERPQAAGARRRLIEATRRLEARARRQGGGRACAEAGSEEAPAPVRRIALVAAVACAVATVSASSAQAYVYWADGNDIGRANLDGSGVNDAFIAGAGASTGVAVDGSHIYWGDGGAIARANLDGSDPQQTFITTDTSPFAAAIATDGTYIYWVTDSSQHPGVYRASLNGTGATDLVPSAGSGLFSLAYADGTLYYGSGSAIYSVPAGGGSPATFVTLTGIDGADTPPLIGGIAAADGVLYWSEATNSNLGTFGDIGSATIGEPGTLEETFIDKLNEPGGVATDGTNVYWIDVGEAPNGIGRAAIATPTGAVDDFIANPGHLQDGIAVDAGIDPTTTTVTCSPTTLTIGEPSSCVVTVGDSASSAVPTGTVTLTGNGGAFFSGSPCQLSPRTGGGATCTIGTDLSSSGPHTITAHYSGDPVHESSAGSASLCVGSATQCGGSHPPPKQPACIVPKLKGKTLPQARAALKRAHCTLGKVRKPRHSHGTLHVSSSKPPAGKKLTNGAKVAVTLAAQSRKRKRKR